MRPNDYETEALKMFNGDIPYERGSWLNVCYENLVEMGLLYRGGEVTEKGKALLEARR